MVSNTLGVEVDVIELRYGLRAVLVSGLEDRPAYVPPPLPAPKHRKRDERRWDVRSLFELEHEEANP
jgi:hypothetical protein